MTRFIITTLFLLVSFSALAQTDTNSLPDNDDAIIINGTGIYQNGEMKQLQERRTRMLAIKEERQKLFNQYNKEKGVLNREYLEILNQNKAESDDEQGKIQQKWIINDFKMRKSKLYEAYKENSNRLSEENASLKRRNIPASSDQKVKRSLPPHFDYNKNFEETKPKVRKKRKSSGYKRRKSQRSKPKSFKPKRSTSRRATTPRRKSRKGSGY